MQVRVLLFAAYREMLGESQLELEVQAGATPKEVFDLLEKRQPKINQLRPYTTFAVNRIVVDPATLLQQGDEVALLQPVSGG